MTVLTNRNNKLHSKDKRELIEALLACASVNDDSQRNAILQELPNNIRNRFTRSDILQTWVLNVINASLRFEDGIEELIDVVQIFEGDSEEMRALYRVKRRLFPTVISRPQLRALESLVRPPIWSREVLIEAYHASAQPSSREAQPAEDSVDELLDEMFGLLADKAQLPSGAFPILDFVAHLANTASPSRQARLHTWLEGAATELGADVTAINTRVTAPADPADTRPTYLLIAPVASDAGKAREFVPDTFTAEEFVVRAWAWRGNDTITELAFDDARQQFTHTASLDTMPEVIRQLRRVNARMLPDEEGSLTIELFVPSELLHYAVDTFPFPVGIKKSVDLGVKYPIVVRSLERISDKYFDVLQDQWRAKWLRFRDLVSATHDRTEGIEPAARAPVAESPEDIPELLLWICQLQDRSLAQLDQGLGNDGVIGMASLVAPAELPPELDVITTMLDAGVPIAFWLRKTAAAPDIEQICRTLLTIKQINRLPQLLWERRKNFGATDPQIWRNVTLMWDDPNRLPPIADPQRRLAAPGNAEKRS
jgi:hypothetical protein